MQQVSGQTLDSSSMWLPSSLDFKAYLCEEKQLALHSYHTASSNGSPANSSFTLHKLHTCSEEGEVAPLVAYSSYTLHTLGYWWGESTHLSCLRATREMGCLQEESW